MTVDEQIAAHPILSPLLGYLQHAQPACQTGCVCGLDAAVDELEASISSGPTSAVCRFTPEPGRLSDKGRELLRLWIRGEVRDLTSGELAALIESALDDLDALRARTATAERLYEEGVRFAAQHLAARKAAEARLAAARADNALLVAAIEHMDTKMTRLSADGEFVTMYQIMAGPWHRVLGLARGALALDESPSALTAATHASTPAGATEPAPPGELDTVYVCLLCDDAGLHWGALMVHLNGRHDVTMMTPKMYHEYRRPWRRSTLFDRTEPAPEQHAYDRACRNAQHSGCTCMHPVNGRWCGKSRHDPIHDVEPAPDEGARGGETVADHPFSPTYDNDMNRLCIQPSSYGTAYCYIPEDKHPPVPSADASPAAVDRGGAG